jgi:hypothetical protein
VPIFAPTMRRALILAGLLLLVAGLALAHPRDLVALDRALARGHPQREGFSFHFPLVTCLLASALVTLVAWLLRR